MINRDYLVISRRLSLYPQSLGTLGLNHGYQELIEVDLLLLSGKHFYKSNDFVTGGFSTLILHDLGSTT